jgi:hypothetical protein
MALRFNEKTRTTNLNTDLIEFGEVKKYTVPAVFSRIPITYNYPSGKDKLSITIPESMSWGVQENKNKQTLKVDSYAFSFVLFNSNSGPTAEEQATIDMLDNVLDSIKKHLLKEKTKESLGVWDKDEDIKRMTIMYRKKERGKIMQGVAPTLYPKLLVKFDKNRPADVPPEITTGFYDENDELINPMDLVGVRCRAVGAVVVDNVYVGGGRFLIQLKLNDVNVTKVFRGGNRLLPSFKQSAPLKKPSCAEEEEDEKSEEEEEEEPKRLVEKKPVVFYKRKA